MTKAGNSQIMRTIPLLITIFSLSLPAYAQYSGGMGEPNDPYQIATAEDLMLLGEIPEDYDKHFILTADINLDPNLPGRKIFDKAVIAPDTNDTKDYFEGVSFTGAFDGKSHVISNLHIQGGDYMGYLGLFGQLDSGAMVSNLGLEAVNVNGTGDYVGGLVGQNDGSIATSYCTGTVSGHMYFGDYVGGLVGLNYGNIAMSYSTGTFTGRWNAGGLAGSNNGNITKSHTMGTVSGDFQIGGLVGANGVGTVTECYSTSTVSGDAGVGGLVGHNWGEITMSYSTGAVNGDLAVGGFVGLNIGIITASYSTSMATGNIETGGLVGQNGVNIPTRERQGTVSNCYSRGAVTGDWAVGGLVGANRLGNIDMSYSTGLVTDTDPNSLTPPVPPDDPLDPIYKGAGGLVGGNISNFTSCFWDVDISGQTTSDGGTGLTTADMQTDSKFLEAGWDFVDETVNGPNDIWKISEGLDYPRFWWEKYGGGAGEPNNPYLIYTAEHLNELGAERNDYDKHFKLMADIDFSGYLYERAVISPDMIDSGLQHEGKPFTGVLDGNGHAISNLTIEGNSFLGLFGYLDSDAIVSNLSIEAADVNGVSDFVGSLAGFSYGNIIGCCCSGEVSGNDDVGGLLGSNTIGGKITNCYSAVTVNGNEKVGGLVGYTKGSVTMCYSTGMVISEGQNTGGLVGERNPSYGIVTDCFWDTQTSGQATSAGGTGKTTAEMQTENTFTDAGWDFVGETVNGPNDIWKMWDGYDYPRLIWEPGPNIPLVFVDINDPGFYGRMSKYEVTNAQYCDFLNAALASGDITVNGADVEGTIGSNSGVDYAGQRYYRGDGSGYTGYGATNGGAARIHYSEGAFSVDNGFDNHPVTYVSWYGAMAFANYYGYYLPTEDQWQAVADYDGTYIYGCGQIIDPGIANYRPSEHPDGTTPAGSFGQYGYDMSDMAGNVWEWTSSSLDSNRIFRGGSLGSYDSDCAVSIRGDGIPYANYYDIGFRICR